MSENRVTENDEYWHIPFDNGLIDTIKFDYAITIEVTDGDYRLGVRIENDLEITNDNFVTKINYGNPQGAETLLRLLHLKVTEIYVYKSGVVEIRIEHNLRLTVKPHIEQLYEAWQLGGTGGLLMVCTPYGEVAYWSSLSKD